MSALLASALGEDSIAWFEVIGAGDIVPRKKPAPEIYHYVLRQLGLEASACVAFEDSANGLLAARGAGIETVITRNGYTRNDDFGGAALVLDRLGDPEFPSTVLQQTQRRDYLDLDAIENLVA